jgi:hypothetical protein
LSTELVCAVTSTRSPSRSIENSDRACRSGRATARATAAGTDDRPTAASRSRLPSPQGGGCPGSAVAEEEEDKAEEEDLDDGSAGFDDVH